MEEGTTGFFMSHPVPGAFLNQLGDMTVSFALLESMMQDLVRVALKIDNRTADIITAELSFKNLRALLLSLFQELGQKNAYYLRLKELIKKTAQIEETGNMLVHSYWSAGTDDTHIFRHKTTAKESKGLVIKRHKLTLDDLTAFVAGIQLVAGEMTIFIDKYARATNQPSSVNWSFE